MAYQYQFGSHAPTAPIEGDIVTLQCVPQIDGCDTKHRGEITRIDEVSSTCTLVHFIDQHGEHVSASAFDVVTA